MTKIKIGYTYLDGMTVPSREGHFDPGMVDEALFKKFERAWNRLNKLCLQIRDQTEADPTE